MPSISILPKDEYEESLANATRTDGKPTKSFLKGTQATPEEVIGMVAEVETNQGFHRRMGEVTEVNIEEATATISELFTENEFTEAGSTVGTPHINLRLPRLGAEHTVKWLEARTDDGEWEQVSETRLDSALNSFTRLKHEHDETRVIKKSYVHNPENLCSLRITPRKDRSGGKTHVDVEQFIDGDEYNQLMDALNVPENATSTTKLGTLYTRSDKREHDATRRHEIVTIQVERVARPNEPGVHTNSLETSTPIEDEIEAVMGPKPTMSME